MALFILLGLILLNGVFAMSELAVVSASRSRIAQLAEDGDKTAQIALNLIDDPNRFLATVQIGITLVGVFSGAFGGAAIAGDLSNWINAQFGLEETLAYQVSLGAIVLLTTYLSLVIGELVPKRIALSNPERITLSIARPMQWLSKASAPIVYFLSKSTELVSQVLRVQGDSAEFITDYQVISMVRDGLTSGEFDEQEHEMVKGALELDDRRVREIATPRTDIIWLNINAPDEEIRRILRDTSFSAYLVAEDEIDNIIGVARTKDMLTNIMENRELNLQAILRQPIYVPETAIISDVLQQFKSNPLHLATIIDEYGSLEGIVTLNDIVEEVLGDVDMGDEQPVQRADGSWLIDGQMAITDLSDLLPDFDLPEDELSDYQTVAGFVLKRLDHIPEPAELTEWAGYTIEVVDMDGQRIDKVLISSTIARN
ncbi:MAG: hemolysin family protein [Anaerolineae bacterium]